MAQIINSYDYPQKGHKARSPSVIIIIADDKEMRNSHARPIPRTLAVVVFAIDFFPVDTHSPFHRSLSSIPR